jgi:hypothetical protein
MAAPERRELSKIIDLEQADAHVQGWEYPVSRQIRRMRIELPGAQRLVLRLEEDTDDA